ncbi:MAG: right-handed parallel beta-helix repeat-containing protein [Pirellulaceae bacterium]
MKSAPHNVAQVLRISSRLSLARSAARIHTGTLNYQRLESRRVLTLPGTLTIAEGDIIAYNGPVVDSVNDTPSFDAFIDFAGDIDSFFFAPQFSGSYTIDVGDFGNTVDPEVAVYVASTGALVGYNDDVSVFNDDARLVLSLVADVRYIVAVADVPATETGNVSIFVAAPARTGSVLLPLDAFGDATTSVLLDVSTDIDYFSITAPANATGNLTVSTNGATFAPRLALFGPTGALLQGPFNVISIGGVIPNQEYRVAVYSINYAGSGSLNLDVNFTNPAGVVSNTLDSGPGSLRQAILDANVHTNNVGTLDKIRFEIPGAGPHTIALASALPAISDAVDIDGGTQAGTGVTPTVAIDGTALAGTADGFRILANNTAIRKINIRNFPNDGIELQANGVLLQGNTIGTDFGGLVGFGNANFGVRIQGGSNNQVLGNVISGNGLSGVLIVGNSADNNTLTDNVIGAGFGGLIALPNGSNGISIIDGDTNSIGSNLISGNTLSGVVLSSGATSNTLTSNKIGTTFSGNAALPNGGDGVIVQTPGNQIGGVLPASRNLISGNGRTGLTISGVAATNNIVEGNFIGTNTSGSASVPNNGNGIRVLNAANNRIGSATDASGRNVISGNGASGIIFSQSGTAGSLVVGNFVGTSSDGLSALGNTGHGVLINSGATNIQIGGSTSLERNVISANGASGVAIAINANGNRISRNRIGTDVSGAPLGNSSSGVFVQSSNNTIGGINANFTNIIGGNTHGVTLNGAGAVNNTISFNTIGTNTAENTARGIQIVNDASNNTIGPDNTIRRNESGIRVNDGSIRNRITRNSIAVNTNLGIDLFPGIGVTPNDAGDADGGGNLLQNSPSISGAPLLIGVDLEIAFSVNSSPTNAAYPLTIEFFISDGSSEGATFIGSTLYTAANFTAGVKTVNFAGGGIGLTAGVSKIVGSATDLNGNTSEFSAQRTVAAGLPPFMFTFQRNGGTFRSGDGTPFSGSVEYRNDLFNTNEFLRSGLSLDPLDVAAFQSTESSKVRGVQSGHATVQKSLSIEVSENQFDRDFVVLELLEVGSLDMDG